MKAILVIDMPSDCNHCQFADFSNGQWECNQHKGGRIGESMKICSTPSWCPLKPMPSARKSMVEWVDAKVKTHDLTEYDKGWNDCVEFLEGEENE